VNLKIDAAQMDLLVHLKADSRRRIIGADQAAVNRDPLLQSSRVHDHLPHRRWRGSDLGGCRDDAQVLLTACAREIDVLD
jgi:hypothetical protein